MAAVGTSPVGLTCTPVEVHVGKRKIRLEHGDLTALPVEAFVFYAREDLDLGSGYGTAIQTRGGGSVKKELEKIGRIQMGQAAITGAGDMKARYIVHACGPKFQEPDVEGKLRACMRSALSAADSAGVKTLAFPPMGTGFYGVPLELAANVMLDCIKPYLEKAASLEEVIICVVDYRDYLPFKKKMESM